MRILMVCLGNICRSPLAEGILNHKLNQAKLDWFIDSAGTGSWHSGSLPDTRSIQVAKKYGIDITNQRARQFKKHDFDDFDLILVMDRSNLNNVLALSSSSSQKSKVKLILNESHPNQNLEVPDPYYDSNGFEAVYQMLDKACDALIQRISK